MLLDQVTAFLLFSLVAAGTPGPANIMLTAAGANAGIVKSLPCLFGFTLNVSLMMFLVSFGLGKLVLGNPVLFTILKTCGAAFLLWLSWKIAFAGRMETDSPKDPVGFFGATLFQWVNPKAWMVCVSAAGTFLQAKAQSPVVQSAFLGGLFFLAAFPSGFLWLAFGAALQRVLAGEKKRRAFNMAMGALLAVSVILMLL